MTPEQAAELRKPFADESVGKLPRVTCRGCRDVKGACDKHRMVRCDGCGNWISSAHLHLDYVGHAEITDRLLAVDPQWTWEPAAVGSDGLPQMGHGGLWIRLTVAGVTRLGFGSADGKNGPDAVKEMIGDALRNAAMRFGVGLDLWGAKYKGGEDGSHESPEAEPEPPRSEAKAQAIEFAIGAAKNEHQLKIAWEMVPESVQSGDLTEDDGRRFSALVKHRREEFAAAQAQQNASVPLPSDGEPPTERATRRMHATFRDLGIDQDGKYGLMSLVTGRDITSATQLTARDVDAVIVHLDALKAKRKETAGATPAQG